MTEIVRIDGLAGFRELVGELGGDGNAVLRDAGIDPEILSDRDAYLPYSKLVLALERAATILKCPDFGLRLSGVRTPEVLGPLAVAMSNAATGREGFECAQRFMHFHNTALRVSMRPVPGTDSDFIGLAIEMRRMPARHVQIYERTVAAADKMMRMFAGPSYRPREIWFQHQAFAPLEAYRRVFQLTPQFGMPEAGVVVAREQLDRPLAGADPQLQRLALHFLESTTLSSDGDGAMTEKVRGLIGRMMRSGEATQADVARALGIHERTLQRRLKDEDTNFEAIKDGVRRDIAQSYLTHKNVPLSHISEMLGYAETSGFTRACRRWFGASPRELRKAAV